MNEVDKKDLVAKYEDKSRVATKGYVTDYLGCKTDISNHSQLSGMSGVVLGFPFPNDGMIHDFIEFVGCCYAIEICSDVFTVVELGAGSGIWSVRSSLLAKRKGCEVNAMCVEADKNKISWIYDNFKANNLEVNITVENKAVTTDGGDIQFPKIADSSWDYGARVTKDNFASVDYRGFEMEYENIKGISFKEILLKYQKVDLLHIDIQGFESEIIPFEMKKLLEKVSVVVIGTHSRKIEGDLFKLFYENKWQLLDEQPCVFNYDINIPTLDGMVVKDGTQIWVNPTC